MPLPFVLQVKSIKRNLILDSVFERGPIPCTHYIIPDAKDYVSTKFYDKLK